MFRYVTLALAALAISSASAQQNDAPAPSTPTATNAVVTMEDPRPGDFWTYEVRDDITGKLSVIRTNVVTEVTATDVSVRFTAKDKDNEGLNIYDRSWNLKGSGPWKYRPHDGSGIQSPLKVGLSWNFQGEDVNSGNGNIWKRSGHSNVIGQENITTKAGKFDTFKIEAVFTRRPTNDPTRKAEITSQTWYAPAIDHWVKRVFMSRVEGHLRVSNTIELVEYGRKN